MRYDVKHQEKFSRGQLILRTLFGWLYIAIPHGFLLGIFGIWSAILSFLAFWAVLFTGRYPAGWYEYQVRYLRWGARVSAQLFNLTDTGASYFPKGTSEAVTLEQETPASISRGLTIVRLLFGAFYVGIPHGFCLFFRLIGTGVLACLAWFTILFGAKYPARWHAFNVGTFRWGYNISLYLLNMTDAYPKFTGKA